MSGGKQGCRMDVQEEGMSRMCWERGAENSASRATSDCEDAFSRADVADPQIAQAVRSRADDSIVATSNRAIVAAALYA